MFELKRRPHRLSYTALSTFESDREEFFLKYCASVSPPRIPQTEPMCVGAAFDAFVKSALCRDLFGPAGVKPEFELTAIFESQVEPQNRTFAYEAGQHVFDCYKRCGAYADLLDMLRKSRSEPRFEFEIQGEMGRPGGKTVPGYGKPDLGFTHECGTRVVLDWKVRGYCSKHSPSPSKNYQLCRDGEARKKPSRSHMKQHAGYLADDLKGLEVNSVCMSVGSKVYADQLATYGWMLGVPVGDEQTAFFVDEIVSKYAGDGMKPLLRIANHRARISADHQWTLLTRYQNCWDAIESGHIFSDMSREDSDARCEVLDQSAGSLHADDWYTEVTRTPKYGS